MTVAPKNNIVKKQLCCSPCHIRKGNFCCQNVIKNNFFTSHKTGQIFKIFAKLNCKSCEFIYLLQCQICHLQQVGKSETSFNLRLSNYRKDSKAKNTVLARKPFQVSIHKFPKDANYTLIEKISKSATTEQLRLILGRYEFLHDYFLLLLKIIIHFDYPFSMQRLQVK